MYHICHRSFTPGTNISFKSIKFTWGKLSANSFSTERLGYLIRLWSQDFCVKVGKGAAQVKYQTPQKHKEVTDRIVAVFTLEDKQIVWTVKSAQMNKTSDVQTGWTNFFRWTNCLIFGRLERRFFPDDLPIVTNKSTTEWHKFTLDRQMPDDLSVRTICSSSSVKMAKQIINSIHDRKVVDLHQNLIRIEKWHMFSIY